MAQAPATPLDIHGDFDRNMLVRAFQLQCKMHELVLITRETIASTLLAMAQADRLLGRHKAAIICDFRCGVTGRTTCAT
jgi:hypothetical protein